MTDFSKRVLVVTYTDFMRPLENDYTNSGDTVYSTAGVSYFFSSRLNSFFITRAELENKLRNDKEWVYKNFDLCIMFKANLFSLAYDNRLLFYADLINKFRVPTYVLGIGAQSSKDYSLDFIKHIKENTKKYVDSIYESGGAITLRGEFTKYALEQVCNYDFFVSGCPSMYFNGRDLKISDDKVDRKVFKPMLNASRVEEIDNRIYKDYKNSVYFDQDFYLKALFCPDKVDNISELKYPFKYLYKNNRINGDMNYYPWSQEIKNGKFNFSYGSRIHGNFIAIQNGVPAFVKVIDSRTRELAEFFNIPNSIETNFNEKTDSLYDLYKEISYDKFNSTFAQRYDNFADFLSKHGIPNVLGQNDEFKKYISQLEYQSYRKNEVIFRQRVDLIKKFPKRNLVYEKMVKLKILVKYFIYSLIEKLMFGELKNKFKDKAARYKNRVEI